MKNKFFEFMSILALSLGFSTTATATLIDRGNGMIYDSDQDITWLQDANNTGGLEVDWYTAKTWADNLTYGGYSDWRLPNADLTCGAIAAVSATSCTGNELGRLFVELGPPVDFGFGSTWGPFNNIQYFAYWSNTEYTPEMASLFLIDIGYQIDTYKNFSVGHAWAVRPGDVGAASVPEPGTMLLLAAGLVGIAGAKRQRR